MFILQAILFAIALSLDGFGVGLSYGIRGIKIPFLPFLIICSSSAIAVSISMLIGNVVATIIPLSLANTVGAILLITIGAYIFTQNFILNIIPSDKIYQIHFKSIKLIISILKEPTEADQDQSGCIDLKEAIFLGIALAMDAIGAGFAAAISGYSPLFTPLFVAIAEFILVSLGLALGSYYSVKKFTGGVTLIPGGLILLLGLKKLF